MMTSIKNGLHYLIHNRALLCDAIVRKCLGFLPDKPYLSLRYRCNMGRWIDWKNPKRFTEKLQWLKLYYRQPIFHDMVDKVEAKLLVEDLIGKEYIIPTLGVWNSFDDIDFSKLPNQFVLKTTNGGGSTGVVVVKDKKELNKIKAKRQLEESMKSSIYKSLREWPYKGLKGRIIAEKYLQDQSGELRDYKFYCFNGVVKCLLIASNRFTNHNFNYYDRNFTPMPIVSSFGTQLHETLVKPEYFDQMIEMAECLSKGLPQIRIDLYNVNGKIYFGEFTFFDSSGYDNFSSDEWDLKFGSWLNLPKKVVK